MHTLWFRHQNSIHSFQLLANLVESISSKKVKEEKHDLVNLAIFPKWIRFYGPKTIWRTAE